MQGFEQKGKKIFKIATWRSEEKDVLKLRGLYLFLYKVLKKKKSPSSNLVDLVMAMTHKDHLINIIFITI